MQTNLRDYLASLNGKQVAVLGIGVSNTPLIHRLLESGAHVTACDKRTRAEFDGLTGQMERQGLRLCLGEDYLDHLDGVDVIFRTPGIRPDLPQIVRAVQGRAQLTSEIEALMNLCPCPIIGVTGSDGKTTTTTIIAGLLQAAGHRVFVGGNIGHPLLCEVDDMGPDDIVVLELSSFQLMTMARSPSVSVVTNVSPNHLDMHRDMAEYVNAKRNIYMYQKPGDKVVLNGDNKITAAFAKESKGSVTLFSRTRQLEAGIYLKDGMVMNGERAILAAKDIRIPGLHNLENYMAAIGAVEGLVPDEVIQQFAYSFGGVAHRIELVRELDGVRYYNDSIASSPTRTIAGLRSFAQKVILIAGGYDKHIPYDKLGLEIAASVKFLILMGATGPKIKEATLSAPDYRQGQPDILECAGLRQAVEQAYQIAQPGDVVILSPASASFDQFKNFAQRGDMFKQYVNELR